MTKDATVRARIDEDIQQGIPFPMIHAKELSILERMTNAQLNAKLEHSYQQAIARQGRPLNAVFTDLERKHI